MNANENKNNAQSSRRSFLRRAAATALLPAAGLADASHAPGPSSSMPAQAPAILPKALREADFYKPHDHAG